MFTCNFLPEPLKFDVQSALVAQHGCSKQVGCIRPAFKWQMTQMFLIYTVVFIASIDHGGGDALNFFFFVSVYCTSRSVSFLHLFLYD